VKGRCLRVRDSNGEGKKNNHHLRIIKEKIASEHIVAEEWAFGQVGFGGGGLFWEGFVLGGNSWGGGVFFWGWLGKPLASASMFSYPRERGGKEGAAGMKSEKEVRK